VDENRIGDHICYISDLSKMREHYPQWDISISLDETIGQIVRNWQTRDSQ
jgi:CDP-paratose 2-epimerase